MSTDAGPVVAAVALCSSLLILIGERADYSAERAPADLDTQSEICSRLAAPREAASP